MAITARRRTATRFVLVLAVLAGGAGTTATAAAGHARPQHKRNVARLPAPSFPWLTVTKPASSPYAPYMGADTWYALGPNLGEQRVVEFTRELVADGLSRAGYRYVWLDDGWWNGTRDAAGNIVVDAARWPHGLAWLTSYIHSQGLLAGIYTDAGDHGCSGTSAGSYGHEQADVNQLAAWGFDALKVDFCGGLAMQLDPRTAYQGFAQAIANDEPRRAMILNICNAAEPGRYQHGAWPSYEYSAFDSWSFAPAIATSWRTSSDIGGPGYVPFVNVLHNLDAAAMHPETAGHGHFSDPDYLVPNEGMSPTEAQTQVTMWTILGAPMMLSTRPASLSPHALRMLTNPEVLAISQDPLGVQGTRASQGAAEVWVKLLRGGQRAVAFLNRGAVSVRATASAATIGMPGAHRLAARDVWQHQTSLHGPSLTVTVPPHGTVLLRVAAV